MRAKTTDRLGIFNRSIYADTHSIECDNHGSNIPVPTNSRDSLFDERERLSSKKAASSFIQDKQLPNQPTTVNLQKNQPCHAGLSKSESSVTCSSNLSTQPIPSDGTFAQMSMSLSSHIISEIIDACAAKNSTLGQKDPYFSNTPIPPKSKPPPLTAIGLSLFEGFPNGNRASSKNCSDQDFTKYQLKDNQNERSKSDESYQISQRCQISKSKELTNHRNLSQQQITNDTQAKQVDPDVWCQGHLQKLRQRPREVKRLRFADDPQHNNMLALSELLDIQRATIESSKEKNLKSAETCPSKTNTQQSTLNSHANNAQTNKGSNTVLGQTVRKSQNIQTAISNDPRNKLKNNQSTLTKNLKVTKQMNLTDEVRKKLCDCGSKESNECSDKSSKDDNIGRPNLGMGFNDNKSFVVENSRSPNIKRQHTSKRKRKSVRGGALNVFEYDSRGHRRKTIVIPKTAALKTASNRTSNNAETDFTPAGTIARVWAKVAEERKSNEKFKKQNGKNLLKYNFGINRKSVRYSTGNIETNKEIGFVGVERRSSEPITGLQSGAGSKLYSRSEFENTSETDVHYSPENKSGSKNKWAFRRNTDERRQPSIEKTQKTPIFADSLKGVDLSVGVSNDNPENVVSENTPRLDVSYLTTNNSTAANNEQSSNPEPPHLKFIGSPELPDTESGRNSPIDFHLALTVKPYRDQKHGNSGDGETKIEDDFKSINRDKVTTEGAENRVKAKRLPKTHDFDDVYGSTIYVSQNPKYRTHNLSPPRMQVRRVKVAERKNKMLEERKFIPDRCWNLVTPNPMDAEILLQKKSMVSENTGENVPKVLIGERQLSTSCNNKHGLSSIQSEDASNTKDNNKHGLSNIQSEDASNTKDKTNCADVALSENSHQSLNSSSSNKVVLPRTSSIPSHVISKKSMRSRNGFVIGGKCGTKSTAAKKGLYTDAMEDCKNALKRISDLKNKRRIKSTQVIKAGDSKSEGLPDRQHDHRRAEEQSNQQIDKTQTSYEPTSDQTQSDDLASIHDSIVTTTQHSKIESRSEFAPSEIGEESTILTSTTDNHVAFFEKRKHLTSSGVWKAASPVRSATERGLTSRKVPVQFVVSEPCTRGLDSPGRMKLTAISSPDVSKLALNRLTAGGEGSIFRCNSSYSKIPKCVSDSNVNEPVSSTRLSPAILNSFQHTPPSDGLPFSQPLKNNVRYQYRLGYFTPTYLPHTEHLEITSGRESPLFRFGRKVSRHFKINQVQADACPGKL